MRRTYPTCDATRPAPAASRATSSGIKKGGHREPSRDERHSDALTLGKIERTRAVLAHVKVLLYLLAVHKPQLGCAARPAASHTVAWAGAAPPQGPRTLVVAPVVTEQHLAVVTSCRITRSGTQDTDARRAPTPPRTMPPGFRTHAAAESTRAMRAGATALSMK